MAARTRPELRCPCRVLGLVEQFAAIDSYYDYVCGLVHRTHRRRRDDV